MAARKQLPLKILILFLLLLPSCNKANTAATPDIDNGPLSEDYVIRPNDDYSMLYTRMFVKNIRRLRRNAQERYPWFDNFLSSSVSSSERVVNDSHEGDNHEGDNHGVTPTKHATRHVNVTGTTITNSTVKHGEVINEHEMHEELSVEVAEMDTYSALVFLACALILGKAFEYVGLPSLIGEIITGFILGPPLADFVPYPEGMVLLGEIGLIFMLVEAGVEIDIAQLKISGARSSAIGVIGSFLPLLTGMSLGLILGLSFKSAIALGACFSPTSLAVAGNALNAGKVSNTPVGQTIMAACVVDDIIGLVILSVIGVLVKVNPPVIEYFIPLLSSFGFLIVLGGSGLTWIPKLINGQILCYFPEEERRDLAALTILGGMVFAYIPLLHFCKSSYLFGAFLAGLAFCQMPFVHHAFIHETHQLLKWLMRVFFAASIGFQVPISYFGDGEVIGYGILFYMCVLAKFPLGFLVPKEIPPKGFPFNPYTRDVAIAGFAMTCRGEMNFIIAAFGLGQGLFDDTTYAAVILAVLLSCITSPLLLVMTIKYYNNKSAEFLENRNDEEDGKVPLYLIIQTRNKNAWGIREKLEEIINSLNLTVIDNRSWAPKGIDAFLVSEMYVQDTSIAVSLTQVKDPTKPTTEPSQDEREEEGKEEETELIKSESNDASAIEARCKMITQALHDGLAEALNEDTSVVNVQQWLPNAAKLESEYSSLRDLIRSESSAKEEAPEITETVPTDARKQKMTNPVMGTSLWDFDEPAQDAAAEVGMMRPSKINPTGGLGYGEGSRPETTKPADINPTGGMGYGAGHRPLPASEPSVAAAGGAPKVEDLLGGLVRTESSKGNKDKGGMLV